jgi:hypothetical protein
MQKQLQCPPVLVINQLIAPIIPLYPKSTVPSILSQLFCIDLFWNLRRTFCHQQKTWFSFFSALQKRNHKSNHFLFLFISFFSIFFVRLNLNILYYYFKNMNSPADFVILRQDSLGKEKFSKNEIQKEVHVVAKNLPFVLEVGSDNINLHSARIYARLFYDADYDNEFKQVDYVKQEPMTYKSFVSANGDRATVEIRLMVLTSQHEDSLFRVKVGIVANDVTYEVMSDPIRVVSKPSQVHKKRKTTSPASPELACPPTPAAAGTKRERVMAVPASDAVLESLHRLEEQQREQRKIIEQLLTQKTSSEPTQRSADTNDDFETAFQKLLNAYNKIPSEERPQKLRRVISNTPETDTITDFISVCCSPESGLPVSKLPFKTGTCVLDSTGTCISPDCVHKKELEAWDSLYSELTWSPSSDV